ncbi:protein phosphatase, partial [Streptomyces sp. NPDC089915]
MSDRDGHPTGPAPHRAPSPAEMLEAIGTGDDEATTCRELAAFLLRTPCDAAAVDLTVDGRTERVASAGTVGLLRAPAPPPAPGGRPG